MIFLNIAVLILEILYYSIFMYYSKGEGKFWRYLLLFSLITILFFFVGTTQIYSYLILVLMMLYGLKYIVKVKTSLYDMLIIILMLFLKIIIETPLYIAFFFSINDLHFIITVIASISKISLILIFKSKCI